MRTANQILGLAISGLCLYYFLKVMFPTQTTVWQERARAALDDANWPVKVATWPTWMQEAAQVRGIRSRVSKLTADELLDLHERLHMAGPA